MEKAEEFEVDQKDVSYLAKLAFDHRKHKTIGHLSRTQQIAVALIQGRHRDNWLVDLGYDIDNLNLAWQRIGAEWAYAIAPARAAYNELIKINQPLKSILVCGAQGGGKSNRHAY